MNQTKYFQEQSLEILKYFHEICEENDLKYLLDDGTLLGAIRHRGFIPWDDDIDIAMPRSDYEKFLKLSVSGFPEHIFVQVNNVDQYYYQHFAKIRDTRSPLTEEYMNHFDIKRGVWVDVFPYDPVLEDDIAENKRIKKINKWYKIWMFITPVIYNEKNDSKVKNHIKKAVIKVLKRSQKRNGLIMRYIHSKHLEARKNILCENGDFKQSGKLRTYNFHFNEKILKSSDCLYGSDFENRKLATFEDGKFYIPLRYDEILRKKYGDYMQLPPLDKRGSEHRIVSD